MEPKTLSNRKPATVGSDEAPPSLGVMTAARDAAKTGQSGGSKLGRETREGNPLYWVYATHLEPHSPKLTFISRYNCIKFGFQIEV